jgi:TM2 domain-containing membrane protein YozV
MTRKKSSFLTFCFSLIPGAGEMYMGFMKQGISIMAVFWLLIFLAAFFGMGPLLFILPILWCYSFFNVHNIRGMSDEEFYALEDDYLFHLNENAFWGKLQGKQGNILAAALIIIGVVIMWNRLADYMMWLLPESIYWHIVDDIPQTVIAVLLIWCGIYLIRGKKKELDGEETKQKIYDIPAEPLMKAEENPMEQGTNKGKPMDQEGQ